MWLLCVVATSLSSLSCSAIYEVRVSEIAKSPSSGGYATAIFLVPPSPEPHTQYCPEKEAPPEGHPPFSCRSAKTVDRGDA